jgi:hypothetical protein
VLLRLKPWACLSTPEEESAAAQQKNQDDDNQQRLGTHSWILWWPTTRRCAQKNSRIAPEPLFFGPSCFFNQGHLIRLAAVTRP